jgi:hypothetical protein
MEGFFGIDILEYVKGMTEQGLYSMECLENLRKIMQGEEIEEGLRNKIKGVRKDVRTNEEFVMNVSLAWMMEDHVEKALKNNKQIADRFKITKSGVDAKREFLAVKDLKRTPDLMLIDRDNGKVIYLELMEDRSGFVKRAGTFNLRSGKLKELQDKNSKENTAAFQVILDQKNKEYLFYRITGNEDLTERPHGPFGGALATTTEVDNPSEIAYKEKELGKIIKLIT